MIVSYVYGNPICLTKRCYLPILYEGLVRRSSDDKSYQLLKSMNLAFGIERLSRTNYFVYDEL